MVTMAGILAGGAAFAGARAYYKYRKRRTPVWLLEQGEYVKSQAEMVVEPNQQEVARRVSFNFNLATFSMLLTVAGVLLYAPLILVALPFNVFDAYVMFEDSWSLLLEQQSVWWVVLALSLVVALTLVAHLHLSSSVLEWLYFLNQRLELAFASFAEATNAPQSSAAAA